MLMIAIRSYLEGIISILLISSTSTSLRCYPINDGFQNSCDIISFPQRLTVLFSEGEEHRIQITLVRWESSRRGCKWVRSKSCIQQTFPIVQKALSGGEGIEQDSQGYKDRASIVVSSKSRKQSMSNGREYFWLRESKIWGQIELGMSGQSFSMLPRNPEDKLTEEQGPSHVSGSYHKVWLLFSKQLLCAALC